MDYSISSLTSIDTSQKQLLSRVNISKVSEIWLHAPSDLAKKLKVPLEQVQTIIAAICKSVAPNVHRLQDYVNNRPDCFTTGDAMLNQALGGGIRTGMITEICGESSSGKTQLALQLALMAQLKETEGGLNCGVAYFNTTAYLPVKRLAEITHAHPLLRAYDQKSLTDNVHSCPTPTTLALTTALKNALPQLCNQAKNPSRNLKPIRVLIIDSLGSLFHSPDKTTTATLVERSKYLSEIGQLLHHFASSQGAAVIVINQVTDVFQPQNAPSQPISQSDEEPELVYKDQAVWFNRTPFHDSYPAREATLGLIWANQINMRIMLSRTRRRIRSSEQEVDVLSKRRKRLDGVGMTTELAFEAFQDDLDGAVEIGTLIRKLSVVFSSVCAPRALEFVVVKEGIQGVDMKPVLPYTVLVPSPAKASTRDPPAPVYSAVAASPPFSNFTSARLTQAIIVPPEKDMVALAVDQGPREAVREEEDFDDFDEAEWASYGMALGDLEEQWDAPEPDNPPPVLLDLTDENEILESSDVEENLLLEGMVSLSQRALVLEPAKQ